MQLAQAVSRKNAIWLGVAALALLAAVFVATRFIGGSGPAGAPGSPGGPTVNSPLAEQIARYAEKLPGADQIRKLSELLNRRSPGERKVGELGLTKDKVRRPRQRALGKIPPRQRALGKIVVPPEVFPDAVYPLDSSPLGLTQPLYAFGPFDFGLNPPTPPGGVLVVPPGPGGVLVVPPVDVPTPTPPPVVPIPEPSTWALMLAGFGFVGFLMRRRRPLLNFGPTPWPVS